MKALITFTGIVNIDIAASPLYDNDNAINNTQTTNITRKSTGEKKQKQNNVNTNQNAQDEIMSIKSIFLRLCSSCFVIQQYFQKRIRK